MSSLESPTTASAEMLACHECDTLHRIPELAPGATAHCHVCGAVMARNPKGGLDRTIALYSTALILLLLANIFPFLMLKMGGRQEVSTLLGASKAMYNAGMGELAVVIFLTSILAPALMMTSGLYVLLAVRFQKPLPAVRLLLSWIGHLEPWVMLDVFMLGVLVAFVKLGDIATMQTGYSLYAFITLILVFAAASSSFDAHLLWRKLETPERTP
ncbi:Paraquat-inducible protein A [hydrothermal vent metagenome]|uniref:Paraquat-inducible protein A n=1 Tax=hydrothermal vent metagenome TaxID=652676 RepID=A0A3B0Z354_9ZZZZ